MTESIARWIGRRQTQHEVEIIDEFEGGEESDPGNIIAFDAKQRKDGESQQNLRMGASESIIPSSLSDLT